MPKAAWFGKALVLLAAGLQGCSSETAGITPLAWTKVAGAGPNGSILGFGSAGDFDERGNFTVSAFKDGSTYYLYYGGADSFGTCAGINSAHWRVGLATSTDGVNFTRVRGALPGGEILDNGPAGAFDSYLTYRPFVLKDGTVWRMWYNGADKPFNCPPDRALDRHIGYAQSADGIAWTKMNDGPGFDGSVLPLGATNDFDSQQVGYIWVLKDTNEYKMYYSGNDSTNTWRVGLAVSSDGRNWTKKRGKLTTTLAVLDIGAAGAIDAACAYQPSVVKESDTLYRMWYRACAQPAAIGGPSGGTVGYAESNDGITWVKIPAGGPRGEAVVAGTAPAFDSGGLTTPAVLIDGNIWAMYYAGFDTKGVFLAGLARAPRQ